MLQQAETYKIVLPGETKWKQLLTAFKLQQRPITAATASPGRWRSSWTLSATPLRPGSSPSAGTR
jgi:hypothetical protein